VYYTICIPTRNRQRYCIETIKAIAASDETDFEVIVVDNSDDPEILGEFFRTRFADDRFRLLPPESSVLSMLDNWERAVAEANGHWISVIGDDDYIDPSLIKLLQRYERVHSGLEVVGWARMNYNWPDNRAKRTAATVPFGHLTLIPSIKNLQDCLYRWSERKNTPSCGIGIYHGAVRRSLMLRIKSKYGDRYFEHPTVDFDNSCKVIREAKAIFFCQRPFSVLGACAVSNSASTQSFEAMQKLAESFYRDLGDGPQIQGDDFPFSPKHPGLAIIAAVAATAWWFCRKYDVDNEGFQENFAHAAMDECMRSRSIEEYQIKVEGFRRGFAAFEGGAWSDHFNPPPYVVRPPAPDMLCGAHEGYLHIRESGLKASTPAEFYRFTESFVMPIEQVIDATPAYAA
jgi:glycosyltransferase involved in cell wall biosynthesis